MSAHNNTTQTLINTHAHALGREGSIDRADPAALFAYYRDHIAPTVREYLANRIEPLGNAFVAALICAYAPLDCNWNPADHYHHIVQYRREPPRLEVATKLGVRILFGYAVRFTKDQLVPVIAAPASSEPAIKLTRDDCNLANALAALFLTPEERDRIAEEAEEARKDRENIAAFQEEEEAQVIQEEEDQLNADEYSARAQEAQEAQLEALYQQLILLDALGFQRQFAQEVLSLSLPDVETLAAKRAELYSQYKALHFTVTGEVLGEP